MCICSSLHWRPTLGNRSDNHLMSNDRLFWQNLHFHVHARGGHIWFTCVNFFHCKLLHLMTTVIKIPKHFLNRYNLGKISMPLIAKHLRKRAVGMLEAGASRKDVAAQVGSSVQAVRSLETAVYADRKHVAVDQVWPRRRKTAIFWTNIYEIVF